MRVALKPALGFLAVFCSAPPFPQSAPPPSGPPMVGDKPLVQVKSKEAAPAKSKAAGKNQPVAVRLQECLDIDDGTKERLNCYDAVIKPEPKEEAAPAKRIADCKFAKEEDERRALHNGFVGDLTKLPK